MTQPVRARGVTALSAVVLAGLLALALWGAPMAEAGDPRTGRIDLEATLEPADLAPGGTGTLVIEGTLLKDQTIKGKPFEGYHIYADGDSNGEGAMTYVPIAAQGVTYDMSTAKITDPIQKTDESGDTRQIWKKHFTLRVKVSLAADAAPNTRLGMSFAYSGCTLGKIASCYPRVRDHLAVVLLAGAADAVNTAKPTIQVPPPSSEGAGEVKLVIVAGDLSEAGVQKGEAVVTFLPGMGWHMYGPDHIGTDIQVKVVPVEQEGIKWGAFILPPGDHIEEPYEVRVPFERAKSATKLELKVTWQACTSGFNGSCATPHMDDLLRAVWPSADGTVETLEPVDVAPPELNEGDILFPVVEGDDLPEGDSSIIQRLMRDSPMLGFGFIFLIGLGLAFTPCVLPIIPITISVISGGNADIPRKRLAGLLATYVLGLSLTFSTMGVVAALSGGAIGGIFAMPAVQWGIAILFMVLGFGMFGVYELQPPAWLMGLQGGAQRRSGSFLGALLFGCLGAIIASPCTGPAIAGMLIVTAKEGSVLLGFSMFFSLGLGMGAVLFAAGSMNFVMRPGPWMVWVRYTFGIVMYAISFYYLKQYQLIDETTLWIAGAAVAVLGAYGISWHLHKKEGEERRPAQVRGAKVGALMLLMLVFVVLYTRVPDNLLSWTKVESPEHLKQLVADSNEAGLPVVVDFWGTWCTNCKVYDTRIAETPELRERFERITRLKVDLSGDDQERWDMRHALGITQSLAPFMVFIDRQGRIRRKADIDGLFDWEQVTRHIDIVLNDTPVPTSVGG